MDSRDLSKKQCEWLYGELVAIVKRLAVIRKRMEQRKFPADDNLYQLVYKAFDAVQRAEHHSHALCCQGQMGTTHFFVGADGIGRTEPSSESPQPHDKPQHHGNQCRAD